VRGFFEHYTRSRDRRGEQWRFTYPGHNVFLLAGVWENDRVSVVTTVPNADVSPIHTRMPLVLAPGESSVWLGPDFARLADRSAVRLVAEKEQA
jgi:putative SOS response-associated peptidase YedK